MTDYSKLSPAELKADVLKTLRARREKIEAMEPTGYVHMIRKLANCHRQGSTTLVGLENATVFQARPAMRPIRNRAGDTSELLPVAAAKLIALRSLDLAIKVVEEQNFFGA